MRQIFTNNASALLAASIDDTETTIQVASGFGVLFPDPSSGEGPDEFFVLTLENADGDIEICHCTARSTDLLTVVRGQEGTVAQAWVNGQTRVEGRVTAGTLDGLLQKDGGTMAGDIDMDGNSIVNPSISGGSVVDGDEIVNTPIRGESGDNSNEFVVPPAGDDPTIGGSRVLTDANLGAQEIIDLIFPTGTILLWYGDPGDIPTGFQLCDGTNGTPNMRNRFVVGAGDTYALGDAGGATNKTTSSDGAHTHTISETVITEDMIPEHHHDLFVYTGGHSSDVDGFSGSGGAAGLAGQDSGPHAYKELGQDGDQLVEDAGGGVSPDGHDHDAASSGAHTHTIADIRPSYRALYFIMKVA